MNDKLTLTGGTVSLRLLGGQFLCRNSGNSRLFGSFLTMRRAYMITVLKIHHICGVVEHIWRVGAAALQLVILK